MINSNLILKNLLIEEEEHKRDGQLKRIFYTPPLLKTIETCSKTRPLADAARYLN